jgi:DNA-binding LytR/AlgR family response regulator
MRALVVDDEAPARRRLADLLDELGVAVIGEAGNGLEALDLARARHPDVIFLDIAMPEVDGFDVARRLDDPRPFIVFQTAYAEFAVAAFEHEALDYLVKPVTRERLAQAVNRIERRATPPAAWDPEQLAQFGAAIRHTSGRPERVLVRQGPGHALVPVADIEHFTSDERLVYAHTAAAAHGTDYTLTDLEERLGGAFVRVSRSALVNLAQVVGIASDGDGSATLTLRSGRAVPVSRRRSGAIRALLKGDPAVRQTF